MSKQTNLLDIISNEKSIEYIVMNVFLIICCIVGIGFIARNLWTRFSEWSGNARYILALSLAINFVAIPILVHFVGKAYSIGVSKSQDYVSGIDTGIETISSMFANYSRQFRGNPQQIMIDNQQKLLELPDIQIIGD